jgi:CRP/FNR family transcriptional regulator, cyclic AMP receptor protein
MLEAVGLLQADPDLGARMTPNRLAAASRALVAQIVSVPEGHWAWEQMLPAPPGVVGFVICSGIFARRARLYDASSVELLGAGDVIMPWASQHDSAIDFDASVDWHVLARGRLALIDNSLLIKSAPWPEISKALLTRAITHARWLASLHAAAGHTRVEDRLWLVLWQIAERWGKTTPEGVTLSVPGLTHEMIASLVAASRPSVTKAFGDLRDRGLLERRPRGLLVLYGAPKDGLARRPARGAPSLKRIPLKPMKRLATSTVGSSSSAAELLPTEMIPATVSAGEQIPAELVA